MTASLRSACLFLLLVLLVALLPAAAAAQEKAAEPEKAPAAGQESKAASHEEGKSAHEGEEEENAEFKESASVRAFARWLGLSPKTAYWVLLVVNFLLIAGCIYWLARARVPEMFRARTASIQKSMEEARRASEEANRRLAGVEERLARLDSEIAALRGAAEAEARADEEHIRALAEADKRKVLEAAEQEIGAATNLARRELKAYAAELAVSLAGKRIQLEPPADKALVRSFTSQLKEDR